MSSTAVSPPPSEPTASDADWLDVGHGHRIYYEQSGAMRGVPVVVLHGGPGSGSSPRHREMFDAARYRIVQSDQRGCGRSTPLGGTAHNHTDALVADIEILRRHLGIERWLVCGGSWGAALALSYAARHREHVSGVVLRGTFLTGREDLDWFFHGAAAFAPEAHADFISTIPRRWQRNVASWLDRCFARADSRCAEIAAAWQAYELRLDGASAPVSLTPDATQRLIAKYRVQAHYLARRCFLGEAAVVRAASLLHGVPVAIVHGEHDRICRPSNAWRVHRACAGSRLAWAAQAGHSPFHPAMSALMRNATDCFAGHGEFSAWPATQRSAGA